MHIGGEVTSTASMDIPAIVRATILDIGCDSSGPKGHPTPGGSRPELLQTFSP
nr:S-adenosylmethionine synthetase N-terminal domain-containing protein [Candidatus Protofrankia californiensis]